MTASTEATGLVVVLVLRATGGFVRRAFNLLRLLASQSTRGHYLLLPASEAACSAPVIVARLAPRGHLSCFFHNFSLSLRKLYATFTRLL